MVVVIIKVILAVAEMGFQVEVVVQGIMVEVVAHMEVVEVVVIHLLHQIQFYNPTSNSQYSNVSETPSITIVDSSGTTLFSSTTSEQILTFIVPGPISEPEPEPEPEPSFNGLLVPLNNANFESPTVNNFTYTISGWVSNNWVALVNNNMGYSSLNVSPTPYGEQFLILEGVNEHIYQGIVVENDYYEFSWFLSPITYFSPLIMGTITNNTNGIIFSNNYIPSSPEEYQKLAK